MGRKSQLNASIDTTILNTAQGIIGHGNMSQWIEERLRLTIGKTKPGEVKLKLTDKQKLAEQEDMIIALKEQLINAQKNVRDLNIQIDNLTEKYNRMKRSNKRY